MSTDDEDCGGHSGLTGELRGVLAAALNRLDPVLAKLRVAEPGEGCTSCPVCALMTAMRGERSDLALRMGEQFAGMLAALRAALVEETEPQAATPQPGSPTRTVQRIPVIRV